MWLLALHSALIVLYIQIELVLSLRAFSIILICSSNISPHRILTDFLLEKFLIRLILLSVLLK